MKTLKTEFENHGNIIREKKRPNDLFLNIFPGKFVAKCRDEETAKILTDLYNKSLNEK